MSDLVASRDCIILGVEHKAGEAVQVDMPPAYQRDLIESGLIVPKAAARPKPQSRVTDAKEE